MPLIQIYECKKVQANFYWLISKADKINKVIINFYTKSLALNYVLGTGDNIPGLRGTESYLLYLQ